MKHGCGSLLNQYTNKLLESISQDTNIPFIAMVGHIWYPEACVSLNLEHRLHSSYEKSIVERTMEYLKDRTEAFDDYYPCIRTGLCNLQHVYQWLILFVFMHNSVIKSQC
jgi:hypothetical protein